MMRRKKEERPKRPAWARASLLTIEAVMAVALIYYAIFEVLDRNGGGMQVLWLPLLGFILTIYASQMISIAFMGPLVTRVSESLALLSVFLFVAWLLFSRPTFFKFDSFAMFAPTLILGLALSTSNLTKERWPVYSVLLRCVGLFVIGFVLFFLLRQIGYSNSSAAVPLVALTLVGLISLLGLYRRHSDTTVAVLADYMASNKVVLGLSAAVLAVSWYFFVMRPGMSDSAAGNATAIEWFVLIVVSAVILLIAYRFLSKRGRELRMGDWGKLVQTIIRDIGEQQQVHTAVKDFIEHGRKERLIVALTKIMSRNGVSDDRIAYALQPLVGYIPNERNMYPIWARGNVQASFEKERTGVARSSLTRAARMMNVDYMMMQNAESMG